MRLRRHYYTYVRVFRKMNLVMITVKIANARLSIYTPNVQIAPPTVFKIGIYFVVHILKFRYEKSALFIRITLPTGNSFWKMLWKPVISLLTWGYRYRNYGRVTGEKISLLFILGALFFRVVAYLSEMCILRDILKILTVNHFWIKWCIYGFPFIR